MTLNRVMAVILRHFTQSGSFRSHYVKLNEARPIMSGIKRSRKILHCVPKKWRQNSNHYNNSISYQN